MDNGLRKDKYKNMLKKCQHIFRRLKIKKQGNLNELNP